MALKKWPVITFMTTKASLGYLIKIQALGDWPAFMTNAAILRHVFLRCANCLHFTSCHHLSPLHLYLLVSLHSMAKMSIFHRYLLAAVSNWPSFSSPCLFCWAHQCWWWWGLVVIMHAWPIAESKLKLLQWGRLARSLVAGKADTSPAEGRWDKESNEVSWR